MEHFTVKISKGNSKVGKLPNLSVRPILDCVNCTHCSEKCYANKSYRMYPSVKNAWDHNSKFFREISEENYWQKFDILDTTVKNIDTERFRIHVAGDFFSQLHLDLWLDVMHNNPDVTFLAFTKSFNLDFGKPPLNFNYYFSLWEGMELPEKPRRFKWAIAGGAFPEITAEGCSGKCDKCDLCFERYENVRFQMH